MINRLVRLLFEQVLGDELRHISDEQLFLLGRLNSLQQQGCIYNQLSDYEFKVFSQFGEDGIIQYLVNSIKPECSNFIEFGVGDFSESNCRFLLQNNNWSGFVIDGSIKNIHRLKKDRKLLEA